jgi:hypothetical protein
MHRSHSSRVVVVVLALLLGTAVGASATASSAGLTSRTVKKIAAKVVTKKARTLSVAHAASADLATTATQATSAGLAAQVQAWTFSVPATTSATTHDVTFPGLPAGTYLATYSMAVNLATGNTITCGFSPATSAPSHAAAPATGFATVSGSSVVTVGTGFNLSCTATAAFAINPYYGQTVTFVPVRSTASAANIS